MSIYCLTTHLLSIDRAHWLKLHDMYKARDAKTWQRKFPVWLPVGVCASNLLFINTFHDAVVCIETNAWLKQALAYWAVNSFGFALEKLPHAEALVQYFPRKIECINRPTRHVLLHYTAVKYRFIQCGWVRLCVITTNIGLGNCSLSVRLQNGGHFVSVSMFNSENDVFVITRPMLPVSNESSPFWYTMVRGYCGSYLPHFRFHWWADCDPQYPYQN